MGEPRFIKPEPYQLGPGLRRGSVVDDITHGASDSATTIRRKYHLPAAFTAILIGKDGGEKLRSAKPFPAAALEATIDAMPMRKAGQR